MNATVTTCLVTMLFAIAVPISSGRIAVAGDLDPAGYDRIEHALIRGDESALPDCRARKCGADMRHLIKAASFRIRWKLDQSLREADACDKSLGYGHDVTRYACARLTNSDAFNLYGYQGYWATVKPLAEALERGYADRVWGRSSSASSNPTIIESRQLAHALGRYHVKDEIVARDGSVGSIPLIGSGDMRAYAYRDPSWRAITPTTNYPSAHVEVNGHDLVMLVDTGSAMTIIYALPAKKAGVKSLVLDSRGTVGATGAPVPTKLGMVDSLKFANLTLDNAIVEIVRRRTGSGVDGVIGLDVIGKIPSLMFTKTRLVLNPPVPRDCNDNLAMSSDLYGRVNGVVAAGSTFNGREVVAVLDTGNATAAVSPTWDLVKHQGMPVTERVRNVFGTIDGPQSFESGRVAGVVQYLGVKRDGGMTIGSSYSGGEIDLNIGMPFFYGRNLYLSFKDMKICMPLAAGPRFSPGQSMLPKIIRGEDEQGS